MKIYLYIRLSSADKDLKFKNESESIANQRALLYQFVNSRSEFLGYDIQEFVDDGYTGTNDNRPSFERMIEHLKNGDSKIVICKDFSRFFRDYVELGDYLERIFPFLGVRFISVNDGYDSKDYKGMTGDMDVVMKYIVYSYYSRDLSQKIKTVTRSRAKRGEYLGSFPPYGYLRDPNDKHHLVIDPETAPVVRDIFRYAQKGKNTGEIARLLNGAEIPTPAAHFKKLYPDCGRFRNASKENCWNYSNVSAVLKRREYTGCVISQKKTWKGIDHPQTLLNDEKDWIVVPNCHEPIISESEYELAQETFKKVKDYKRQPRDYPLRSLVHCGNCGRTMSRCPNGKKIYYRCEKSIANGDRSACPFDERYYESDLERIVFASIRQMLTLLLDGDKRMNELAAKTKDTEANLKQLVRRMETAISQNHLEKLSFYEQYSDGKISREEYTAVRDRLAAEEERAKTEKKQAEEQLAALSNRQNGAMATLVDKAHEALDAPAFTNRMLLFFIERIDIYAGMKVEIHYRFKDELEQFITCNE